MMHLKPMYNLTLLHRCVCLFFCVYAGGGGVCCNCLCVCVCVCVCVWTCVCVKKSFTFTINNLTVSLSFCMHVCMRACVHACVSVSVCIHSLFMQVSLHHYSSKHKDSVIVCVINFIPPHTAVHRGQWVGHICCRLLPHEGVGGNGLCTPTQSERVPYAGFCKATGGTGCIADNR